jgi:hypothetical protein
MASVILVVCMLPSSVETDCSPWHEIECCA